MSGLLKQLEKKRSIVLILMSLAVVLMLSGCSGTEEESQPVSSGEDTSESSGAGTPSSGEEEAYTLETKVEDVINDPAFGDYGRLIFPADRTIDDDLTLQDAGEILTWYNNVNPERTVAIANELRKQAASGEQIFYDIYTDEEKGKIRTKKIQVFFFFRGDPGAKTAIVNAGGGFVYVAAMHDSFPHAMELSEMGYNAFALIYRPGADTACEDLARAIAFLHEHAEELQIDMEDY